MMLVTAFFIFRDGGYGCTPLARTVQRDGIAFYVYLQVLVIFNIIFTKREPPETDLPIASIHRILHTVLTSRMLLNIRRAAFRGQDQEGFNSASFPGLSAIEFHVMPPGTSS